MSDSSDDGIHRRSTQSSHRHSQSGVRLPARPIEDFSEVEVLFNPHTLKLHRELKAKAEECSKMKDQLILLHSLRADETKATADMRALLVDEIVSLKLMLKHANGDR